jgi:hypothetical protein
MQYRIKIEIPVTRSTFTLPLVSYPTSRTKKAGHDGPGFLNDLRECVAAYFALASDALEMSSALLRLKMSLAISFCLPSSV